MGPGNSCQGEFIGKNFGYANLAKIKENTEWKVSSRGKTWNRSLHSRALTQRLKKQGVDVAVE